MEVDEAIWYQLIIALLFLKYTTRVIFQTGCLGLFSSDSLEFRQRIFFFVEHVLFTIWGFICVIYYPGNSSWYYTPRLCWVYPPHMPSESFHYYYIAKCGTHLEDVLYRMYENFVRPPALQSIVVSDSSSQTGRLESKPENGNRPNSQPDVMMDIHHYATALLCLLSYASGYYHIGSLLMLIHDASDIPLDLLKIGMTLNWDILTYASYAVTLVAWAYFRLYYLAVLLYSLVFDTTTSFIFPCEGSWENATCARGMYMEMSVYVLLIGSLWVLHLLWFRKMLRKGYKLIVGGESAHN
uniref:TLC domain-containing protein n=1 Tax=Spumella elongata TaxID=89044 RepID=A0A7S3GZQ1_9STRA